MNTIEITLSGQREKLRSKVLEMLAKDAPLADMLETIALGTEQYSPGTICSILLTDKEKKHLLLGAAPNLPDFYNEAINGVKIGKGVGSCGTAADTCKRVIVEDVQTHPYWAPFKDLTKRAGLVSCWSQPILNANGQPLGTFAIYNANPPSPGPKDIELIESLTNLVAIILERYQASLALKESKEKYQNLIEQASDGIFIFDSKGNFIDVNVVGCKMTGYSKGELQQLNIRDIVARENLQTNPLKLKELSEGKHLIIERKVVRKDGSRFYAEISTNQLSNGTSMALMRDITKRKYAEKALKESEEKFRSLIEQASDGIFIADPNGNFLGINTSASQMIGYTKDELLGLNMLIITPEEERAATSSRLQALREGKHIMFERKVKRKDGSVFDAEVSAKLLQDGNFHAIMRDITIRKNAELALKESERNLTLTFDYTTDLMGLVEINKKGEFIFKTANKPNREFIKFLGIDINNYYGAELKAYGKTYLGFSEEEALYIEKLYQQVVSEKKPVTVQNSFQDTHGDMFYNETTVNPVFEEDGSIKQVLYVTRDTTETKKAEIALKESEKKLALTLDSTTDPMGLVRINEAGEFIFDTANKATRESNKLLQINDKDYFGAELKQFCINFLGFTKEKALELERTYQQVVADKKPLKVYNSQVDTQGNPFHSETTISPVFENGKVTQVLWVNKDITEAKRAEELLLLSEQKLNEAQKIAKIGSWEYDFASKQLSWSAEQYRILELEGTPHDKLLKAFQDKAHPDDFPKFEQNDKKAIETGEGFSYEYRIICNDGSIKYLITIGEPIKNLDGKVIGLKGTDQDITDKVEAQKKLLQSMIAGEDKERKRLAAELHDSLGQTLSLISINLDSVINTKDINATLAKQKLQASLEMVNQTVEEIRTISQGLTPPALEKYGLRAVIKNMLAQVNLVSDITINYTFDNSIDRFDPNIEMNVYRIVQEALNNTLKHADAQNFTAAFKKEDDFLHILFEDDGKGFDLNNNMKASNGLKNIENRVYILGGTINIQSTLKKGTSLKIKIPVQNEN